MYSKNKNSANFPDPLVSQEVKESKEYGLVSKAVENQWGDFANTESLYRKRNKVFEKNRVCKWNSRHLHYKQLLKFSRSQQW